LRVALRLAGVVAVLIGLAGCSDPPEDQAAAADQPPQTKPAETAENNSTESAFDSDLMKVVLRGDGITVETASRAIPLKLDSATEAEVERAFLPFGKAERSEGPEDCPAGPLTFLEFPNRLQLAFQQGKFVGFWADERSLGVATPGGIKPGSPRTALGNAPHQEASFGKLVEVDGAVALLDEAGEKVTDVYAGAACIYD
jgi:hypothetical protein